MDDVLDAWRLPTPRALTPAPWGVNNTTSLVSCAAGEFVLRIYLNRSELSPIQYEHALLDRLSQADLSFETPVPIRLPSGLTTARDPTGRPAALFKRLPGEHVDDLTDGLSRTAGNALAELTAALGGIGDLGVPAPRFDADYTAVHPLVPDPSNVPEVDAATRVELTRISREIMPVYASIPRQISHGDFALGNVLFSRGRVSALLDFEFSGSDVRAIDLATACYILTGHRRAADNWRPFVEGYISRVRLQEAEAIALPTLMSSHAAVGLIHWIGRHRAGLAPRQSVTAHAVRLLEMREWRRWHGDDLVRLAMPS